jgi:hypothetical protein
MLLLFVAKRELVIKMSLYSISVILSKVKCLTLILISEVYELTYACYVLSTLITRRLNYFADSFHIDKLIAICIGV